MPRPRAPEELASVSPPCHIVVPRGAEDPLEALDGRAAGAAAPA
jgi:hypothetical protein